MENTVLPAKVKISEDVLFQEIASEFVLLNMETEKYYGLDEVGARFWELLKEEEETEKVLQALLEEYDVTAENLRGDVAILLESLKRERLVIY